MQRMDRVRERDYALVDTLNEHYTNFGESIDDAYPNWRKYSYEELEAEAEAKREALHAAVARRGRDHRRRARWPEHQQQRGLGGIDGRRHRRHVRVQERLDMRSEVKMHGESLKQLGSSFQNEVQPSVIDIEGRTLELKGSRGAAVRRVAPPAARTLRERDWPAGDGGGGFRQAGGKPALSPAG